MFFFIIISNENLRGWKLIDMIWWLSLALHMPYFFAKILSFYYLKSQMTLGILKISASPTFANPPPKKRLMKCYLSFPDMSCFHSTKETSPNGAPYHLAKISSKFHPEKKKSLALNFLLMRCPSMIFLNSSVSWCALCSSVFSWTKVSALPKNKKKRKTNPYQY